MKKLYFVRHGLTQSNVDGVFNRIDDPLVDEGREQARLAGQKAKAEGLHFDRIIASPHTRTVETAQIIANELSYPLDQIETMDLLVERKMGPMMGAAFSDFFTEGRIYKDLDDIDGVEDVKDLQARADEALETLKSRPESTILVVSHGAFGRAFRRATLGLPYTEEYRGDRPFEQIPNATITQLIPPLATESAETEAHKTAAKV